MKSLTYFEQLEKIIYKSILKNNKEMLIFLKTEEKKEIAKLSIDDLNNLLDQLFNSHQFLQTEKIPTDTLIINQFEKNICLKRLINIIIDNILSYDQLEICFSSLEEHYLVKEGLLENSILDDCIAFRTDYIERVIGRIFESKDIPHNKKQKIIGDLLFVYSNLEEDKAKVISVKADQEVKRAQLSALQEKKQSEINKLSADEKAKQAELDAYNAKLKEIDDAIAEALRKAQEEEKKNNATNGGNGSSFDGTFAWPLDYSPRRVTSRMKYRWGRWHKGIDIGTNAEIGKRVIAAASGTVIYSAYQAGSSSSAGYGNYLIIYHGNGYCSLYAHMNSKAVSTGQRVSQGQLIGYSGNTGGVAPHLHFEIRKATSIGDFFGNNWKDPLDYLPGGYTIVD